MAKATLTLANGTAVVVEGSVDEVNALIAFYGGLTPASAGAAAPAKPAKRRQRKRATTRPKPSPTGGSGEDGVDIAEIIKLVKNCDEAEAIETQILDRASQVDRTLLPLYIVHEYLDNKYSLSSGEISKITSNLGVPVSQPNVSRTLSGSASRYVIGDRVRVKGMQVRYKLSRRGVQYLKSVITGAPGEEQE